MWLFGFDTVGWATQEKEFENPKRVALSLDSSNASVHAGPIQYLAENGQWTEASAEIDRAQQDHRRGGGKRGWPPNSSGNDDTPPKMDGVLQRIEEGGALRGERRTLARPAIAREGEAGEADEHHRPGRGFRNGGRGEIERRDSRRRGEAGLREVVGEGKQSDVPEV
jgi:hypothetical protein